MPASPVSSATKQLKSLASRNALSFMDIAKMLDVTPQHARALMLGKYPAQPKHIRLIELELLDRQRDAKRRA
jgi:hypothetical protein